MRHDQPEVSSLVSGGSQVESVEGFLFQNSLEYFFGSTHVVTRGSENRTDLTEGELEGRSSVSARGSKDSWKGGLEGQVMGEAVKWGNGTRGGEAVPHRQFDLSYENMVSDSIEEVSSSAALRHRLVSSKTGLTTGIGICFVKQEIAASSSKIKCGKKSCFVTLNTCIALE